MILTNDNIKSNEILSIEYFLDYELLENVDSELKYLGKTRKELASSVGFDAANISFGIKRNSVPTADTALRIAHFLGISLDYLLDMEEENTPSAHDIKISEIESRLRRFSPTDLNVILSVVNAINEKY